MKFEAVRFDFAEEPGVYKFDDTELTCEHCGETMAAGLIWTNHNIVWNGWCSKRLFVTKRCIDRQTREAVDAKFAGWKLKDRDWLWKVAQEDMAWLAAHGFPIVDPNGEDE